jgi:FixJ family two-component response regulator
VTALRSLVSVVDDDQSVRGIATRLAEDELFYGSGVFLGEAFLASALVGQTKCLILDIALRQA